MASARQPRTRGQNQPRRASGRPKRGRWSAAAATHHPFSRVRPNPPVRGFWPATGRARLGSTGLVRLLRPGAPGAGVGPIAGSQSGGGRRLVARLLGAASPDWPARGLQVSCRFPPRPGPGRLSACGRTRRTALTELVASEAQVTRLIRQRHPAGRFGRPRTFGLDRVPSLGWPQDRRDLWTL